MADWTSLLGALDGAVLSVFGREVVYRPQAGEDVTVRAIFQPAREGEESSPGVYGVMFVLLTDLPCAPERGDQVVIDDAVYKVFRIEAEGQGAATLSVRIE